MSRDGAVRTGWRTALAIAVLVLATTAAMRGWQHYRTPALGAAIAERARQGDIRLISSQTCVFCARARQWLRLQRVTFSECFIERDADCAAQYRSLMRPGTPVVLVRGQAQLGFDPQRVLDRLRRG